MPLRNQARRGRWVLVTVAAIIGVLLAAMVALLIWEPQPPVSRIERVIPGDRFAR
jgi:hypothetical protein